MHSIKCNCPKCQIARELEWSEAEFPSFGEFYGKTGFENPFSEIEELELAAELLSVTSEAELDLFLGKLVRGAWKGLKKVGSFVGRIAKPLGGILKAVAKKALPFVGGALGSVIPIPGVGTAVGSAVGGALSKALEMEFGGLAQEKQELEMARRFVRLARTAARQAALASANADPQQAAEVAVANAARQQALNLPPQLVGRSSTSNRTIGAAPTGRWLRRGNQIAVLDV